MPQPKPEVGEPLSSGCGSSKNSTSKIDLCDDVIEDILPHPRIAVDVAVFSACPAIGSARVRYGNIDCFCAAGVLCLDCLQTSTKCEGYRYVKVNGALYVVAIVRPLVTCAMLFTKLEIEYYWLAVATQ